MEATANFAGPLFPSGLCWERKLTGLDMPRIADWLGNAVVFLYRTEDEARARVKIGGTGFLVSYPIPSSKEIAGRMLYVPYLVSNRHVVFNGGASVVSINRTDGSPPDVIPFEPTDWTEHPDGDDVAAICLFGHTNKADHLTSHIPIDTLLTPQGIASMRVGVGDEVFMLGRFVNHQGHGSNRPSARFGSISMGLEPIWNVATGRWQESFAVEMRSRTGFSGSPVAVYRTPATVLSPDIPEDRREFWGLLGINWGYILDEDGENTWLNGVVPAWKILEVFDVPKLKKRQQELVDDFHKQHGPGSATTAFASGPGETDNKNPKHREDFTRLLDVAARKREQED